MMEFTSQFLISSSPPPVHLFFKYILWTNFSKICYGALRIIICEFPVKEQSLESGVRNEVKTHTHTKKYTRIKGSRLIYLGAVDFFRLFSIILFKNHGLQGYS